MEERGAGGGAGARVVVLVDMDCFYCQVEQARSPELRGRPLAVVQYNPWLGGGIIAVNYEARARGVTRHMRGDQARAACPDLALVAVPSTRGKADIGRYREAGERVARVLQRCAPLLERASIDEAYLDITAPVQERLKTTNIDTLTKSQMPNTFALGYDSWEEFMRDALYGANECLDFDPENAQALLVGALIVSEIRDAVYKETGYECSAGIAHNKILAKLVCGMNKPNKQTVLPKHSVNILYSSLSLKKVKHLGGKFGDTVCELLRIKTMGELQRFSERELQNKFDEKNGMWLYNIARGIDTEPVQAKFNPKSIGCCKQFKGKAAILHLDSLSKWLKDLGDEIEERLEKDSLQCNRVPKQMVVSFMSQFPDGRDVSSSRSYNFTIEDVICGDLLYSKSFELIMESTESVKPKENEENRKLRMPIKFLGISVGKFEDKSDKKNSKKIVDFFGAGSSKQNETLQHADSNIEESNSLINAKQEKKPSKSKDKTKDKETVFQRFFQSTNKILSSNSNQQIENQVAATSSEVPTNIDNNGDSEIKNNVASQHISSTLDKQESFFQRFLNNGKISPTSLRISDTNISNHKNTADSIINCLSNKDFRPNTPICNIIQCGNEDSNSNYSSSTIDIEINKSISLFEDSPDKSKHIDKMRSLLNASLKIDSGQILNSDDETPDDLELAANNEKIDINSKENEESQPAERSDELICPECKKRIPTEMFTTHSDYHLALKLREEERIECRKHVVDAQKVTDKKASKTVEKLPVLKEAKIQTKSIASFFSKIDDNKPKEICVECGQKVPVDKFSEHLDFHEAQKLSREINNKISPSFKTVNKSAVKRKQTTSPIKKPKKPCASIDSFFR